MLKSQKVGSPLSYVSLAQDLQIAPNTVKKYISILESLYIVFLVRPFHKNIARSILREPKLYFFDSGFVKADEGVRLENTCAVCLLKHVQYACDVRGKDMVLNYIRTKDGKDADFVIVEDSAPQTLIEVKTSESRPAKSLVHFASRFPSAQAIQLVHHLHQEEHQSGVHIRRAGDWLARLDA
jgi:predicted AAA+ superfamily ATPase